MEDRKQCPLCKSLVSKFAFNRHVNSCDSDPRHFQGGDNKKEVKYKTVFTGFCVFCKKECKNYNSQINHELRCKLNPNKLEYLDRKGKSNPCYGKKPWNKDLTKEIDERLRKASETYKEGIRTGRIIPSMLGKKTSDEIKEKISKSRIEFLQNNPGMVPYKLNHYSKGPSYPERYFIECINKNKINLKYHYNINRYELDFYNIDLKFYLEIDGDQHYLDPVIVRSDKRRTLYLENLGWTGIRVRWKTWKSLSQEDKNLFILNLKKYCDKELVELYNVI